MADPAQIGPPYESDWTRRRKLPVPRPPATNRNAIAATGPSQHHCDAPCPRRWTL